ncbi:two-component system phosphate regulon sensor histidine kinase PhoR [Sphingomonas sp. BE138]|uniref:ATP-binding protein n=1 Tax=Sphingomonas sp. BE138 TaxID=2817845 RepID=UPI002856E9C4|nr:ATP-binding protein [Sphingomonas sp. BE138]MDR6787089.1 two-component system phosphate regulon sensor histidine kinase PhoR [Sphingomonas sp. BE138]
MIDEIPLRTWLAVAIAVATAAVVFLLSGDGQAALAALAGGAALVVIVATIPEELAADRPAPAAPAPELPAEAVVEAITDPVLVLRGGRVTLANVAARRLLGAHILGEDARVAIRHPGAAEHLAHGAAEPVDLVGIGTLDQRWQMRAAAIDDDARLVQLVDRTGQHAAERMRVDFVANASHELRTPLASILGYVETLADEAGEDAGLRKRFLGIVFDEARRMEQLVEDLMSLSRIEAEKFRELRAAIDLGAVAHEAADALATTHGDRGTDIRLDIGDTLPLVTGDSAQLSQLIHNLIGNAMKYGRAGTPVEVIVSAQGQNVCMTVTDQGDGIPPEHLPRLTERFYRVDPGRSRSVGGTGLGLAIVKHIVERHRGRLDIASTVGVGTRVTVTLPAVPKQLS